VNPATGQTGCPVGVFAAGIYALVLAFFVVASALHQLATEGLIDAAIIVLVPVVIGGALGATGVALIQGRPSALWFLAIAPLASLILAMQWPGLLWPGSTPRTTLLIVLFLPLVYLLARDDSLEYLAVNGRGWLVRGGKVFLWALVPTLIILTFVESPPNAFGIHLESLRRPLMEDFLTPAGGKENPTWVSAGYLLLRNYVVAMFLVWLVCARDVSKAEASGAPKRPLSTP